MLPSERANLLRCAQASQVPADIVSARNALAGAVRSLAVRTIEASKVPRDVAEDLAHHITLTVVDRIERGLVAEGCEDAYTRRCARNRAQDHHRHQSGVFERTRLREEADDESLVTDEDAEQLLLKIEEHSHTQAIVQQMRALLDMAPERYRDVLLSVYIDGVPIEELARIELARRIEYGEAMVTDEASRRAAHKRARDAIDKLLQRGREWLRARLMPQVRFLSNAPRRPLFSDDEDTIPRDATPAALIARR